MLDPSSPFPLLQQTEHPTTGDIVWSIHPCRVATAVGEVLSHSSSGLAAPETGGRPDATDVDTETNVEWGLRWLETWFMLSSTIVDLSYP
jgi:metal transporter CNNM